MHICTVEATANARVQSLTKALSFLNDVRSYTVSSVHLGENPINYVIICPASVLLCLSLFLSSHPFSLSLYIYFLRYLPHTPSLTNATPHAHFNKLLSIIIIMKV